MPIFAPWLSPELLLEGPSGSDAAEAAGVDVIADESAVVEAMFEPDAGVDVGHAVDGPYWTMR